MQAIGVVCSQLQRQVPGLTSILHSLVGPIGHYPYSLSIENGNELFQLLLIPAPIGLSEDEFEVDIALIRPKAEIKVRSLLGAHHCAVNLLQNLQGNDIGAIALDVNLHPPAAKPADQIYQLIHLQGWLTAGYYHPLALAFNSLQQLKDGEI